VSAISARSFFALAYLIVFGSLIGFTAYIWLLGATTSARVSTYAYVNPVVAVLLGWSLAGEPMSLRTLIAAAVIIGAVALIIRYGARREVPATSPNEAAPVRVRLPRKTAGGRA
jgi:drug/metabolite transporter (DMT)-like permease